MFEVKSSKKLGKSLKSKLMAGALSAAIMIGGLTTTAYAGTINNPDVYVNDSEIVYTEDVPTRLDGVVYIPFTNMYNGRRYSYTYDAKTKEIVISSEYYNLRLKEGEKTFTVNGHSFESDEAPKMIDGDLYLPIYIMSKMVGANTVEFNDETYRINFVTSQKKINESRIEDLNKRLDDNKNLDYWERSMIKDFVKKYVNLENPTLDEFERMSNILSSVDIASKYDYNSNDYYTIKNSLITVNSYKAGYISTYDSVRNALVHLFKERRNDLLTDGVGEILSAEAMGENTNHNPEMVTIAKMLSDIIGSDKLLLAYQRNNMSIIKDELMSIYNDEALYNDFIRLIDNISYNSNLRRNGYKNNSIKRAVERNYKDDALHIYGIIDTYYQCKYGRRIELDDVMESYLAELLSHGDEKSFKTEPKIFSGEQDVYQIYHTPQDAYDRYASYYNYYYSSRPLMYKGNGEPLRLVYR